MACNLQTMRSLSSKAAFKSGLASRPTLAVSRGANRRSLQVEARSYAVGLGIMGTKAGMMSFFTPEGLCVPATVIALEEGNVVTQIKTVDTDGYNAVQIGYKVVEQRKVKKPELGHLEKAGVKPMKHLKEFKLKDRAKVESYQPGQQLEVSELFKEGEVVDVSGVSIGKGFQGTIKRWNHKRGLMTHGSKSHRQHGSIGAATTPARVLPGLKMAGQMGNKRITVRKQEVLKIDTARRAIVIKGTIPGKPGALIEILQTKTVGKNC